MSEGILPRKDRNMIKRFPMIKKQRGERRDEKSSYSQEIQGTNEVYNADNLLADS